MHEDSQCPQRSSECDASSQPPSLSGLSVSDRSGNGPADAPQSVRHYPHAAVTRKLLASLHSCRSSCQLSVSSLLAKLIPCTCWLFCGVC